MLRVTTREETLVRDAANILDVIKPEWAERINIDTLDMGDCYECILGQVFKRSWWRRFFGFEYDSPYARGLEAMRVAGYTGRAAFSQYQTEWIQAVRARR